MVQRDSPVKSVGVRKATGLKSSPRLFDRPGIYRLIVSRAAKIPKSDLVISLRSGFFSLKAADFSGQQNQRQRSRATYDTQRSR